MTAPALISAANVKVRYRNGATGVLDVSLDVRAGQTVALLGPNGAGKTTTMRALSGFMRSEETRIVEGSVTFEGRDITNLEPHQVAALGIMYVPERRKIFPNLTVLENLVALGRLAHQSTRAQLMSQVFEMFPILAERRTMAAGQLSGGQQQMLAIGRAVMSEAKLLLLDEMTLGLHTSLKPVLFDVVRRINKAGTAVLLSDESAEFALAVCDYCYVIRDGAISDKGEPKRFEEGHHLALGYLG